MQRRASSMAKVIVKLPHISWRDGRPRFNPGPMLRRLGFRGEDLREPDGSWMTLAASQAWIVARMAEIDARKARKAAGARLRPITGKSAYTVEAMFEDLWSGQRFKKVGGAGGLAPRTVSDYRKKARSLETFDPELYGSPAAAVTKPVAIALHEALWEAKGLAMANGILTVLRLAYSQATRAGRLANNPCERLRLPTSAARLRVATSQEIEALITAADTMDEHAIADAIVLALYTAQRQADVLTLVDSFEENGRIRFIQHKTGARVRVRAAPVLRARLVDLHARKRAAGLSAVPATVVDPRTRAPFNEHTFRHRFAAVRARASAVCESVLTFRFADLRDTAVTRLALAGCTMPEIAGVTGHSLETINTIMKHYLEIGEAHADAAIDKLEVWLAKEGIDR